MKTFKQCHNFYYSGILQHEMSLNLWGQGADVTPEREMSLTGSCVEPWPLACGTIFVSALVSWNWLEKVVTERCVPHSLFTSYLPGGELFCSTTMLPATSLCLTTAWEQQNQVILNSNLSKREPKHTFSPFRLLPQYPSQ